jgi:hypothetical protein
MMDSELEQRIEAYLLERGDWVSGTEICWRFGIQDERQLRQVGDKPGLCTRFAVSGDHGFRHVARASTSEWLEFKHRVRKHGIRELARVKRLGTRRQDALRRPAPGGMNVEKDSGQILLPGVGMGVR